jgi:hypothetical protein
MAAIAQMIGWTRAIGDQPRAPGTVSFDALIGAGAATAVRDRRSSGLGTIGNF